MHVNNITLRIERTTKRGKAGLTLCDPRECPPGLTPPSTQITLRDGSTSALGLQHANAPASKLPSRASPVSAPVALKIPSSTMSHEVQFADALTLASRLLFRLSARLDFRAGLTTGRHLLSHQCPGALLSPLHTRQLESLAHRLGNLWFEVWSLNTVSPPFITLTPFQPFGLRPIILRLSFALLYPSTIGALPLRPLFFHTAHAVQGSSSLRKTPLGPGPGLAATSRGALPAASSCARPAVAVLPILFCPLSFSLLQQVSKFLTSLRPPSPSPSGPTTTPSNSPPASPTLNPTQRSEDATRERTRMGPFHNSFFLKVSTYGAHYVNTLLKLRRDCNRCIGNVCLYPASARLLTSTLARKHIVDVTPNRLTPLPSQPLNGRAVSVWPPSISSVAGNRLQDPAILATVWSLWTQSSWFDYEVGQPMSSYLRRWATDVKHSLPI
ncbi:hypothetical protein BDP55DRAFT_309227 [Colletotrichum godetiae]|uniref:Uncharacterized protein n=1 Tax=Colletotrichum godetiae TaxID=1209918 RepID=A0AAJ0AVX2_9PEZI|nr:uncharacterized protein BDP55DRAFT_309227 [Colletotrichum godetiae]KAK1690803.1 hypothetical protein BDP55DRAFT_309227 [Colletotrichum godetiae]